MTDNSDQKIPETAENFIKLALELSKQEAAGEVDQKLCDDILEAAKELISVSDPILESKADEELQALVEVLKCPSSKERAKRQAQMTVGRIAGTIIATTIGTAVSSFAKGYFTKLGQQAAEAYPVFGPNGIFNEGINKMTRNPSDISDQLKSFNENNWS